MVFLSFIMLCRTMDFPYTFRFFLGIVHKTSCCVIQSRYHHNSAHCEPFYFPCRAFYEINYIYHQRQARKEYSSPEPWIVKYFFHRIFPFQIFFITSLIIFLIFLTCSLSFEASCVSSHSASSLEHPFVSFFLPQR